MEPIQLTEINECLIPPAGTGPDTILPQRGKILGTHEVCLGGMVRGPASRTHDFIRCTSCGFRDTFPNEVSTYGQLARYFESRLG